MLRRAGHLERKLQHGEAQQHHASWHRQRQRSAHHVLRAATVESVQRTANQQCKHSDTPSKASWLRTECCVVCAPSSLTYAASSDVSVTRQPKASVNSSSGHTVTGDVRRGMCILRTNERIQRTLQWKHCVMHGFCYALGKFMLNVPEHHTPKQGTHRLLSIVLP